MTKNLFLSITMIFASGFAACTNAVFHDDDAPLCEPGDMLPDSTGCLAGCDHGASAYFCTADGRAKECRLLAGRTCVTDPTCSGDGADCTAGTGACLRHGITSCPADSTTASLCSAAAGDPVEEVCGDGVDQDCNGVVDDDHVCPETRSCVTTPEICGNGIDEDCSGGDLACPPTCTPATEVCDSVDNDCDGFRDEGGVCAMCTENMGGMLRIRPSAALRATCARGLVTIAWGPGGVELRSGVGADSYAIVMSESWLGWVGIQAFCPSDAARGSEIGNWAGTVTDWSPLSGRTLREVGFTVDIDDRDISDAGYVCRVLGAYKPFIPLDECSTFACPR